MVMWRSRVRLPLVALFLMSGFIYTVFTSNGLSDTVFTIVPVLYQWFFTNQINSCQTHHWLHSFFMPTDSNLFRIHQAAKNSGSFQWHSIITGSKRRTTVMHQLYTVPISETEYSLHPIILTRCMKQQSN